MKIRTTIILFVCCLTTFAQAPKPFRIGIAGMTHDHIKGMLKRASDSDIQIVGIAEPNKALYDRYMKQFNLSLPWFPSLTEMLDKTKPEAVLAFNSIEEHLEVVQICAPRKIPVMVEKPLAVSMDHARQMESLIKKYGIPLLTNFETTWYSSHYELQNMLPQLGEIHKIVVHDGHNGPKEIGCSKEFLDWLTDPVKNGGGAVIDFGCYGANLTTWLMNGSKPLTVSATLQQIKPDIYPKVDDEATIVLTYPKAQAILQASWNWPYGRKDMEVYGKVGYAIADRGSLRFRYPPALVEDKKLTEKPFHDAYAYLAAVVRGEITLKPTDLSSFENNFIVVEILEAAKESAKTGKVVYLK
jgi:predicted dehydrogenase